MNELAVKMAAALHTLASMIGAIPRAGLGAPQSPSLVMDPFEELRRLLPMLLAGGSIEDALQLLIMLLQMLQGSDGQNPDGDSEGGFPQHDSYSPSRGSPGLAPRYNEADPEGTVKAGTLGRSARSDSDRDGGGSDVPSSPGLQSWDGAPVNERMADRIGSPGIRAEIERAASAKGIDPDVAKAIVGIESGGNPGAQTGSYKGLFQLSDDEFAKFGRGGHIFEPRANIEAGLNSLAHKAGAFEEKYARPPTPTELYLAHQQGEAGLANHLANPDGSAVLNMARTGEGRSKGIGWARRAIWGNVPTDQRHLFPGGPDSMTSREFGAVWAAKLQGIPVDEGARSQARVFGAFGPNPEQSGARADASSWRERANAAWSSQFDPHRLARNAAAVANDMSSAGRCKAGVRRAFERTGLGSIAGRSAYMAADQLAQRRDFDEVRASGGSLRSLPSGSVVVWDRTRASPDGHVSVALGNGYEASDHIAPQRTSLRGDRGPRVFVPTNGT